MRSRRAAWVLSLWWWWAGVEAGGSRAAVPGAVRLGALFAIHAAPGGPSGAGGTRCGAVREHYGIQRVEATLQALDAINADTTLLPGLPLGAELRDSCWAPPTALRQTIDLVRDAITPPDASDDGIMCVQGKSRETAPLLGVLGPGASAAAQQVQNLLQLFSIPQVSYSATSRELSDRGRFSTFFRVVPSDRHQARLLVALLRAHNWTYVHAVYTDESYGQSGMAVFREEASRGGVCVAREEPLRAAPAPGDVDAALRRLAAGPQVAVCWCEGRTARALLEGLRRRAGAALLRLVASDGWADRQDVVAGVESAARGSLTLRIRSPHLAHFDTYYHALRPLTNTRNPWFQEFWEQKFNCSLSGAASEKTRACSGDESLAVGYSQEPKLALVVRGVYALAHALHDMRAAECGTAAGPGLCPAMLPFNVSLYQRYLARVNFRAPDGGRVAFDENGDPLAELSEYDVMMLAGDARRGWRYERVGHWRRGALRLRGGPRATARRASQASAVCSAACAAGEWARAAGGRGRARCCWACVPCAPLAVTRAPPRPGCRLCPPGHRPDRARTVCIPSPVEWGEWGGARTTAAAAGLGGLLLVAVCGAVFWRHRATPVVKSASRELCSLLLLAAAVCHAAALAAAARPSTPACVVTRLAAPALSGVYAAVLARTVRIARLVAAVERAPARRPRLLSSRAQVGAWVALSAPGVCAAAWSAAAWSPAARLLHPGRARSVLACGGEHAAAQLLPLAPALLLLAACAALAVRTRRLPHNLSETRFIGAAAYTTSVAWAAFFGVYAATGVDTRASALCGCVSLSAGGVLLLSLGPRVWVCVCRPQRNTRAHFLTATSIRCHLGKYRPDAAAHHPPRLSSHGAQYQHASSQTSIRTSMESDRCEAAGVCARVTATPAAPGGDVLDVLITLLPHAHVSHDPHAHVP